MEDRQKTQYLVRTPDGLDYCRVEPWEGGLPSAKSAAQRLGGFVVELDKFLGEKDVVADFRG
ncbi:hypothetical protein GS896_27370 [Rhodococcus hoagii]|nr:hypothetical protein [Prescottella equi]MBM4653972.1 hypothetical protein [Prescottella equi]MBM4719762.1 hypothetical protein [Prescottella equi]NKR23562.1 hypothetical protein [Prescottella equi]NKT56284.1 hypothetical protein [Prescottella equi]